MAKKKKKKLKLKKSILFILFVFLLIGLLIIVLNNKKENDGDFYIPFITEKIKIEISLEKDNLKQENYLALNNELDLYTNHDELEYVFDNNNIIKIENNKIVPLNVGEVIFYGRYKNNKSNEIKIIVTDLITKPSLEKKAKLKCNQFNKDENNTLNKILKFRVEESGYKTRAGVVAAARFLSLEFPKTIEYFYENGRMDYPRSGRRKVDAEGRYYHEGLYLTKNDIKYKDYGPAPWGCKIYERTRKAEMPNGLDCSGFITWALKQAGYDPGDVGAGVHKNIKSDLDDLGIKKDLSENIKSDIKVGDLIGFNGHIAMIIGIQSNKYYIVESYTDKGKNSLHIDEYSYKDLLNSKFKYVMLMDSYYKDNGKFNNMW